MIKYMAGDKFQNKEGIDSVDLQIIFVPPVDGNGIQHYLCSVFSGYADNAKSMFLSLKKEEDINHYFTRRTQPFVWPPQK